ncbi:amino acid permease [Chryseobacterium carnipullorum]|uniref:Amino acid permease n=1 Tax=Chryseobacterium carnipullorum TaxID=1124835 RepID=A0A376EU99_CHRCU|nr:amino acid permease [Chryseobacterium carnipullorum]AZA48063.1 amino acid permease [Chryseobacterium carnipullorum]AZA67377.1 amino acid permease [Chryseobacterium carnipullorum]STD13740.1 Serine/threonine exchanger SteT [Chryseobacterium carnipullorum]
MSTATHQIGWKTAAAIVVSNMIGTGIFTTLGFQLSDITNTYSIFLLWIIGGILALFGAFCYAELGSYFKGNGGDYIYLKETYHPVFGYLVSWISLIIGFSAPVALAALAMSKYLSAFNYTFGNGFAIGFIFLVAATLSFSLKTSSRFHNFFTLIKIAFIIVLVILGGVLPGSASGNSLEFGTSWQDEIMLPAFATSLVFVTYSYTGWNSASYIAGEIKEVQKNLPRALIVGTVFVTLSYLLVNYIMLKHAPVVQMAGKEDVMGEAAGNMLGIGFGKIVNIFIALQLIATISGYLWVGSRLTQAFAKENHLWRSLAVNNKKGIPVRAIFVHAVIASVIILTGSFKEIFVYTAFILQLFASLSISTVFFLKKDQRKIFKSNLFYIFPAVFLLFSIYILYFTLIHNPKESIIGLGIVAFGLILYAVDQRFFKKPTE